MDGGQRTGDIDQKYVADPFAALIKTLDLIDADLVLAESCGKLGRQQSIYRRPGLVKGVDIDCYLRMFGDRLADPKGGDPEILSESHSRDSKSIEFARAARNFLIKSG